MEINWNIVIVCIYLSSMLIFGWWGKQHTKNQSDYLVAGRRLGAFLYTGTMAAVVLGGGATVGGVTLGYKYGISGAWLVVSIGLGMLILSACFSGTLQRLKIYTISQMLSLRYGAGKIEISSVIVLLYTILLCTISTVAYASVFEVLFGWNRFFSIILGSSIVIAYSVIGGMWSITIADMAQFMIKTVGVFFLMLPIAWHNANEMAGGIDGIKQRLGEQFFQPTGIGLWAIISYLITYTFGTLIAQEIWQRVFTGKNATVTRVGGSIAGVYCILYGIAGALIGVAAKVLNSSIDPEHADGVYSYVASEVLPVGIGGFVLAAALAAMMSTASGGLIAAATVASQDVIPMFKNFIKHRSFVPPVSDASKDQNVSEEKGEEDVSRDRWWIFGLGILVVLISLLPIDVGGSLTLTFNVLVCGLLIPVIGGLLWKRGTDVGAMAAMIAGTVSIIGFMIMISFTKYNHNITEVLADETIIYVGLAFSLVAYVVVSLMTKPNQEVLAQWNERLSQARQKEEA